MPLHTGHLGLITHGLEHCKNITILLVVSSHEELDPELRYSWLVEHYENEKGIEIDVTYRDEINALPPEKRTDAWCKFISLEYPELDCIISSESYGDILAEYLGIDHLKFDQEREITPISATEIRNDVHKFIHFLPEHVKKFYKQDGTGQPD